jgi:hypothetical protein
MALLYSIFCLAIEFNMDNKVICFFRTLKCIFLLLLTSLFMAVSEFLTPEGEESAWKRYFFERTFGFHFVHLQRRAARLS